MRISLKGKSIIKKIALALAGVAAITAVGFGVKAIVDYTKNDLKKITLTYDVGNLGSDGKYVNDESTLYTEEAFGCYGLQVKPDFDSTVNYQIFYYDILDNYISSTEVMSEGYSGEAPVNGAYARIVIDPREDEDGKISLTERIKYPAQLTVKVKKEQDINNRYIVFKGKVMQVVSDTDCLVFTRNTIFNPDICNFVEDSLYFYSAVTSSTLFKVSGGSTVAFDNSDLSDKSSSFFKVYQFKDFPSSETMIVASDYSAEKSLVLDKQARYIIISVSQHDPATPWTDAHIAALPSCFSVTKTK